MRKTLNFTHISFISFVFTIGVLHIWYFQELMQNIPRMTFKLLFTSFLLVPLLILFSVNIRKNINHVTILTFILIAYLLLYNFFYYFNYTIINSTVSTEILIYNLTYIYGYLLFFLVGFYYSGYARYDKYIYALYWLLAVNALTYVDTTTLVIGLDNASKELIGIYLLLGDSFALVALVAIVITQSKKAQYFIMLTSLLVLFILMSRTSLYFFALTIIAYMVIKNKGLFAIYLLLFFIFLVVLNFANPTLVNETINSRMLGFLFGKADASVDIRSEYFNIGLDVIQSEWFEGGFGSDVLHFGTTGRHMHNFLELLRQYGITAFAIFIVMIVFLIKELFFWSRNVQLFSLDYDIFIVISIFLLLEVAISRSLAFPYIFLPIGIMAGLCKNREWTHKPKWSSQK